MSALEVLDQLRVVVDATQKTYRAWINGGITEITPEDELWKSFSELAGIGKQSAGIVGPYFEAAADFWRKWNTFTRAAHASPEDVNIVSVDVWGSWEAIEDIRTAELFRAAPPLETLAQLEKQNVGPNQICEIYGWKDNYGRPMLSRVAEESSKDPKHRLTPKNPLQARFDREHAERTEIVQNYRNRARRKVEAATKPGPESLEELVATGVSAEQISKIKRISTEEIYRLCEEKGLDFPPLSYDPAVQRPKRPAKPLESAAKDERAASPAAKRGPGRPKKEPAPPPNGKKPGKSLPPPPVEDAGTDEDSDPEDISAPGSDDDRIDENIRTYLGAGLGPAEVMQMMIDSGDPVDLARIKRVKASSMAMADSDEE